MTEKRQSLEEMLVVDVDVHFHEKPAKQNYTVADLKGLKWSGL